MTWRSWLTQAAAATLVMFLIALVIKRDVAGAVIVSVPIAVGVALARAILSPLQVEQDERRPESDRDDV